MQFSYDYCHVNFSDIPVIIDIDCRLNLRCLMQLFSKRKSVTLGENKSPI